MLYVVKKEDEFVDIDPAISFRREVGKYIDMWYYTGNSMDDYLEMSETQFALICNEMKVKIDEKEMIFTDGHTTIRGFTQKQEAQEFFTYLKLKG